MELFMRGGVGFDSQSLLWGYEGDGLYGVVRDLGGYYDSVRSVVGCSRVEYDYVVEYMRRYMAMLLSQGYGYRGYSYFVYPSVRYLEKIGNYSAAMDMKMWHDRGVVFSYWSRIDYMVVERRLSRKMYDSMVKDYKGSYMLDLNVIWHKRLLNRVRKKNMLKKQK